MSSKTICCDRKERSFGKGPFKIVHSLETLEILGFLDSPHGVWRNKENPFQWVCSLWDLTEEVEGMRICVCCAHAACQGCPVLGGVGMWVGLELPE